MGNSYAGPVQSELKSYRCLVPDWSKTSGGVSPALSPDGKTLVYVVRQSSDFFNDQIWVLSGLDEYNPGNEYASQPTKLPEPWQINCGELKTLEELNTSVWGGSSSSPSDFRNVDWSPNGKSVAFIRHGRLFVAEELDPKTKSAKVRLLADVGEVPKESLPGGSPSHKYAEAVLVPRWSPDGALIAFLRPAPPPGVANRVCVVDVGTGKETVLARDAVNGDSIWEKPWSPDSRSLAYSCQQPVKSGNGYIADGINIVSIAGGSPRKVVKETMALCPSWSPQGSLLAYLGSIECFGNINIYPTIYTCRIEQGKRTPIAKVTLSATVLATARAQVRASLPSVIKRKYSGIFSATEIKSMTSGSISDSDVIAIMFIAEGKKQAKEMGGDFQQKVDAALKRWPIRGKHKFNASADIMDAESVLPVEKQKAFQEKISNAIVGIFQPLMSLNSTIDMAPAWSPNGKCLAFTRWDIATGYMRLIVVDMPNRKSRTVFESNVVGNVTWTPDSKSLVLSSKRNLAYKGKSASPCSPFAWPDLITMPSYSEIWVLDLK